MKEERDNVYEGEDLNTFIFNLHQDLMKAKTIWELACEVGDTDEPKMWEDFDVLRRNMILICQIATARGYTQAEQVNARLTGSWSG